MTSDATTLPLTTTAMDTPERRTLSWLTLAAGLALAVTTGATLLEAPATEPHVTPWGVTSETGSVDTRSTDASGTVAAWSAPAAPDHRGCELRGLTHRGGASPPRLDRRCESRVLRAGVPQRTALVSLLGATARR